MSAHHHAITKAKTGGPLVPLAAVVRLTGLAEYRILELVSAKRIRSEIIKHILYISLDDAERVALAASGGASR